MRVIGEVETRVDLARAFARRRVELGIGQRALDHAAGLADGHISKLECGTRRLGPVTIPTLLAALGLRLIRQGPDDPLLVVETGEPLPPRVQALVGSLAVFARVPSIIAAQAKAAQSA